MSAASTQTHKRLEVVFVIVLHYHVCHIQEFSANLHLVRLIPACAENSSTHRNDVGKHISVEPNKPVLHQPAEAVFKTDNLVTVLS